MTLDRIVLCIKWGDLFGPEYVNVLYRACRANLTGPFRFVCLTSDTTGLDREIETHPIPGVGLSEDQWYTPGVWPKIGIFSKELAFLDGRCLFIDLDMMVTGALDVFFESAAPFIALDGGKNWRPGQSGHEPMTATGVFAFNAGTLSHVVDAFAADREEAMQKFANEQQFVGAHVGDIEYWPKDWVISFKRWLRRPIGLDFLLSPKKPDPSVRIVAFHGTPRPVDLISQDAGFWDAFPRLGHGRVEWVHDYWIKYGSSEASH